MERDMKIEHLSIFMTYSEGIGSKRSFYQDSIEFNGLSEESQNKIKEIVEKEYPKIRMLRSLEK